MRWIGRFVNNLRPKTVIFRPSFGPLPVSGFSPVATPEASGAQPGPGRTTRDYRAAMQPR